MKTDKNIVYTDDNGRQSVLPAGTVLQPLYPHADQDGFMGEWRVIAHLKSGKTECSIKLDD